MDTESAVVAAFSEMYKQTRDPVFRYLARRAGKEVATDLVDEVFTLAWRRWSQVPQARPLPWLYTAAQRLLANELRSASRRLTVPWASFDETGAGISTDPSDSVATAAVVRQVLEELPQADCEVLLLAAWEGLKNGEIGEVLGCGRATATVRLHRARLKFRKRYAAAMADTAIEAPALARRSVSADIRSTPEEGRS